MREIVLNRAAEIEGAVMQAELIAAKSQIEAALLLLGKGDIEAAEISAEKALHNLSNVCFIGTATEQYIELLKVKGIISRDQADISQPVTPSLNGEQPQPNIASYELIDPPSEEPHVPVNGQPVLPQVSQEDDDQEPEEISLGNDFIRLFPERGILIVNGEEKRLKEAELIFINALMGAQGEWYSDLRGLYKLALGEEKSRDFNEKLQLLEKIREKLGDSKEESMILQVQKEGMRTVAMRIVWDPVEIQQEPAIVYTSNEAVGQIQVVSSEEIRKDPFPEIDDLTPIEQRAYGIIREKYPILNSEWAALVYGEPEVPIGKKIKRLANMIISLRGKLNKDGVAIPNIAPRGRGVEALYALKRIPVVAEPDMAITTSPEEAEKK